MAKTKNIVSFTLALAQVTTPEADGDSAKPHKAKIAQNDFSGFATICFVGSTYYRHISYANKLNTNTAMKPNYIGILSLRTIDFKNNV